MMYCLIDNTKVAPVEQFLFKSEVSQIECASSSIHPYWSFNGGPLPVLMRRVRKNILNVEYFTKENRGQVECKGRNRRGQDFFATSILNAIGKF